MRRLKGTHKVSPRPLGRRVAAAGTGLLAAVSLAACTPHPSPEVAVRSFLLAWQDGDHAEAAQYTDGDPAEVESALEDVRDQLDLDSIDAVDMAVHLQKMTGKRVELSKLKEIRTVGDVVDLVALHLEGGPESEVAEVAPEAVPSAEAS